MRPAQCQSGVVFDDFVVPHITMGAATRMTGLSPQQLRRIHARGWLTPPGVDPVSGHRRYTGTDIQDLRLFAALVATGMPAADAGRVLADGDGTPVSAHLEALADHLETIRRLAPPEKAGYVRRLRLPYEQVLAVNVTGELENELDTWLARAAAHRGSGTLELPRVPRGDGVPDGAAVSVSRPDDEDPEDVTLYLPWDDQPPPDGLAVSTWWGGDSLVCAITGDVDVTTAHRSIDREVERLRLIEMGRRLLYTPERVCAALMVRVTD